MAIAFKELGYTPQPKPTNRRRFKKFVNRINRRQWEFLNDSVHSNLTYNGQSLTLFAFIQLLKDEFGQRGAHVRMDPVVIVGGREDGDGEVAARLRVSAAVVEGPHLRAAARRRSQYARHMFVAFAKKKITAISDISDADERARRAQNIVALPALRPPPPPVSIDMRRFYGDYLACINAGRIVLDADRFCKPGGVVWNGRKLTVAQYAKQIQDSLEAIDGLRFAARTVLVDETRQLLAVQLDFRGTPVKPYAGAVPNGRDVTFSEHALYWLEQGKISDVLTIIDWDAYRSQLGQ